MKREIMALEDFLAGLDPKTAKRIKTAQETEIERLPLASYGLTEALGGGIAKGRISTFYGNQSAGKTLLFQECVALWQQSGMVCAWVDAEDSYDKEWAARLGVDNDELILIHSKSSGRIEKEIAPLLDAEIDVIIIDSVSDIMPEAFVDDKTGELNDQEKRKQMGAHAKAITQLIAGILYRNKNTAIVLLSQTTTDLSMTYPQQIPHGGKKILFASSQMVSMKSSNTEKEQIKGNMWIGNTVIEDLIGRKVSCIVQKNKLGKQWNVCEYDMYYAGDDIGIDKIAEVIDEGIKFEAIKKSGGWFTIGNGTQVQGRPALVTLLKSEPDELEKVIAAIAEVKAQERV